MLTEQTINRFLADTAGSDPVPGGGSVSALAGAAAAALVEMVAGLTAGRKGFESVDADMRRLKENAARLRHRLAAAVDGDAAAYGQVMAAFQLPNGTGAEKDARRRAVQAALQDAAEVPLQVARDALELLELARRAVQHGNPNTVTDGAVAAMMARTAVFGALYNVMINVNSLRDDVYRTRIHGEVQALRAAAERKETELRARVEADHSL